VRNNRIGKLGVGLVYWPELAPLFDDTDLVSVIEIEPQVYWEKISGPQGIRYRPNERLLDSIRQRPQAKLLHGVGQPIGGVVDDAVDYAGSLQHMIELFDPPWISEHLSFNRISADTDAQEVGFLLPPRQTDAGVDLAVQNIRRYARTAGRPFAFETGVNYLQQQPDEMSDGDYFAAVSSRADCGIVLDLHNLWCNQCNGRQSVLDALAQMPLDRVWELHLAGGMAFEGYWLDAHSQGVPEPVVELARQVMPRLPNLGAIVFEILPQHLPSFGIDGVRQQLLTLWDLWDLQPASSAASQTQPGSFPARVSAPPSHTVDVAEIVGWEQSLASALRDDSTAVDPRFKWLQQDPGLVVFRLLIGDARRSNIARSLRYTTTLLLLGLGEPELKALLDGYFDTHAPDMFPAHEADHFAGHLHQHAALIARIPYLAEVLAFEHALVRATIFAISTEVAWSHDPTAILEALEKGHAPPELPAMQQVMHVSVDRNLV
jgi:uncharacterized protein (UPF0276 family)